MFGIETEYAMIYHPARGERGRPTNLALYGIFERALETRVASLPRAFSLLRAKRGRFLENGASFHYEGTPQHFEHGLLELASPECRDPFALLACERAKDELVEELAREVSARLGELRFAGEVRIGKNNVDSQGHTFGSHESYWISDPLTPRRKLALAPLWALLWLATLPVFAWLAVASLALLVLAAGLLVLPVLAGLPALLAPLAAALRLPAASRALREASGRLARLPLRVFAYAEAQPGALVRRLSVLEAPLHPLLELHTRLHRRFHFQPIERGLTAFLVTRTLFAGAGAVAFDGAPLLRLAQRPPHLRALSRIFTSGDERPLYEIRDLFFRPWSAFATRRRLHLLLGDANLCDWAQVLRVGSTALVLEAIEADPDGDWPRLADPLGALRAVSGDSALRGELALAGGAGRRSALALQREYLARVRGALARAAEPPVDWKVRVVAMWQETLDLLERDPETLADRVDWLAKRSLLRRVLRNESDVRALEASGAKLLAGDAPSDPEARRLRGLAYSALRTDLRYHELGAGGGHRRLRQQGRIRSLVSDAEVKRARREPPADTRARGRGLAIREAAHTSKGGAATWHRVRIGRFDWRWLLDPLDPGSTRSARGRGETKQQG